MLLKHNNYWITCSLAHGSTSHKMSLKSVDKFLRYLQANNWDQKHNLFGRGNTYYQNTRYEGLYWWEAEVVANRRGTSYCSELHWTVYFYWILFWMAAQSGLLCVWQTRDFSSKLNKKRQPIPTGTRGQLTFKNLQAKHLIILLNSPLV